MKKLFALALIVLLGCLFPHLFLALVLLAALGWIALDMFISWVLRIGLEVENSELKRRLEERERQVPAIDRFQAWLDSNQRR